MWNFSAEIKATLLQSIISPFSPPLTPLASSWAKLSNSLTVGSQEVCLRNSWGIEATIWILAQGKGQGEAKFKFSRSLVGWSTGGVILEKWIQRLKYPCRGAGLGMEHWDLQRLVNQRHSAIAGSLFKQKSMRAFTALPVTAGAATDKHGCRKGRGGMGGGEHLTYIQQGKSHDQQHGEEGHWAGAARDSHPGFKNLTIITGEGLLARSFTHVHPDNARLLADPSKRSCMASFTGTKHCLYWSAVKWPGKYTAVADNCAVITYMAEKMENYNWTSFKKNLHSRKM